MEDEVYELAKYRLEKARNDLASAELNFENKLFSQSINCVVLKIVDKKVVVVAVIFLFFFASFFFSFC
ncbi:MAG: hypothetical protein M3R36_18925 [Bacteroidota bacterium]|nr:hypothetical protein [Bacteroidota bacterium]